MTEYFTNIMQAIFKIQDVFHNPPTFKTHHEEARLLSIILNDLVFLGEDRRLQQDDKRTS